MITAAQLSKSLQCPIACAEKWGGYINTAMAKFGINTPLRIAHFLAQVGHESGRLIYTCEIASGRNYEGRADLGNTKPEAIRISKLHGSTPGRWWKGHGLIQVTGYDNHLACGAVLGLDLLNNPALLELPQNAALSAAWFWHTRNLNEMADNDLLTKITKRINGGLNGLDDRRTLLVAAKEALKLSVMKGEHA